MRGRSLATDGTRLLTGNGATGATTPHRGFESRRPRQHFDVPGARIAKPPKLSPGQKEVNDARHRFPHDPSVTWDQAATQSPHTNTTKFQGACQLAPPA